MDARGGNQISPFENRVDIFVKTLAAAAERTGVRRSTSRKRFERPHVDANQLLGVDAHEVGQGAIDAKNIVLLVVDHYEVTDRVEDFQPMAVGLLHAGKKTGVLESDAGVAGDGAQQLLIFAARRSAPVGETKNADLFPRG